VVRIKGGRRCSRRVGTTPGPSRSADEQKIATLKRHSAIKREESGQEQVKKKISPTEIAIFAKQWSGRLREEGEKWRLGDEKKRSKEPHRTELVACRASKKRSSSYQLSYKTMERRAKKSGGPSGRDQTSESSKIPGEEEPSRSGAVNRKKGRGGLLPDPTVGGCSQ